MTEPIKLPPIPDKIVGWYTTNRPDVEAWGRLAVEQNTAGLREQLQAARICGEAAEKATVSLVGQLREAGDSLYECLKRAEKAEAERDEARAECLEQARLNGMGSEREARLMAQVQEGQAELARLTTLRPASEWDRETIVVWYLLIGYEWIPCGLDDGTHWTPLPPVKEAK